MSCKLRPLQAVARIRRISCSGSGPLDASSTPIEDATHRAGYPRVTRSHPSIANSENIWKHNHRSAFISKCWEAASAAEPLLQMSCKLRPLQAVTRIRRISCSGSGPLDASSTPIEDATHRAGYPRVMRSYPSIANSKNIWEHNHRSAFISKC